MQLIDALRYSKRTTLAFVGAGGKTTAIFKAARELSGTRGLDGHPKTVLVTTTTHFGAWQIEQADHAFRIELESDITRLEQNLPDGVVLLAGEETNNRIGGMPAEMLEKVQRIAENHQLPLLIEADGSNSCPLKAPAKHEPVIPDFTQCVIVVAGLTGLGKPLSKNWIHRPEIFADLSGLNTGDVVSIDALVKVLRNHHGGLKNIPTHARRIMLLNQADTKKLQSQGRTVASQLIPDYHSIIIASLTKENKVRPSDTNVKLKQPGRIHAVIERIGGIVLAAGRASRFGRPKQLLLWRGEPLIRHVALAALKAGLTPVVVVVGAMADNIGPVISDLPVRIVKNIEWKTGLSSSIRAGIVDLPIELGGVVFLHADQPQVSHLLIKSLVETHQQTLGPIVAPQIDGQRGNPVLFDAKTFPALLSLKEDMGGKLLFSQFPVEWITWHDRDQLMDIDTPDEYQKFLEIFPDRDGEA